MIIATSPDLASDAVVLVTERTLEYVDIVVIYRPPGTVGSLAVERVLHVGLRLLHRLLLVLLVDCRGHQLYEEFRIEFNISKLYSQL